MPNFNENTVGFLEFPIYYYDTVYSMSLPVRGVGGALQVLATAWNPVTLVPDLLISESARARVSIVFQAVAPATADTLLDLVKSVAGVAAASATSIGVTATKTLIITDIIFSIKAGAAAAAFATLTLRQNPAGATVIGSPSELRVDVGNTAAVVGAADQVSIPIPGGMAFKGAQTLGISLAAQAVTNIVSITLLGYEQ